MTSSTRTSGADAPAVIAEARDIAEHVPVDIGGALHQHRARAAGAFGDFLQPQRIGGIRRAHDDHGVDLRRDQLHRLLAVGGGVADVFLVRTDDLRKARLQPRDDLRGVVDRERGLRHIGKLRRIARGESVSVGNRLDQGGGARGKLPQGADHLRMSGMADQQNLTSAAPMNFRLAMHLGDQRTGGVEREEVRVAGPPPAPTAARHARRRSPARQCRGFHPVPRRRRRPWRAGPPTT